jgi:hypothetical protein
MLNIKLYSFTNYNIILRHFYIIKHFIYNLVNISGIFKKNYIKMEL